MEWCTLLEIGIPLLDNQHRTLVEKLNELGMSMKKGRGGDAIAQVLAFLRNYAEEHFRDEEGLMARHGYPGLGCQQKAHAAFRQELERHVEAFAQDPTSRSVTLEIHRWGLHWLRDHILNLDSQFGDYLRDRGIQADPSDAP